MKYKPGAPRKKFMPTPARILLVRKYLDLGWSLGLAVNKAEITPGEWYKQSKTNPEIAEIRRNYEERRLDIMRKMFDVAKGSKANIG